MCEMLIVKVRESRSVQKRLLTLIDQIVYIIGDCEVTQSSDGRK